MFRDECPAVLGALWRDRDQGRSKRLDLWKDGLQSYQLRIAVGSPHAPEEREQEWTARETIIDAYLVAVLVRERHGWQAITDPECPLGQTGLLQLFRPAGCTLTTTSLSIQHEPRSLSRIPTISDLRIGHCVRHEIGCP